MAENEADVSEFNSMKSALPGDRARIRAVGQYVLELYSDPLGQRPRVVIEVNARDTDDDGNVGYWKTDSIWFNPKDDDGNGHDDPMEAAKVAFDEMAQSEATVEAWMAKSA